MTMTDTAENPCKFIIVGFDGLRPCDITPEIMPNLARFREQHHSWDNYLASFPSETYVNHPVIFSGERPNRHGVIANSFYCPTLDAEAKLFCGWDTQSVLAQDAARTEGLYAVPDLGELLASRGKTLRVLCANSAGSTRLQHVHAERYEGHLNACIHALGEAVPLSERERLLKTDPAEMPLTFPDFAAQSAMTDIFFRDELREGAKSLADVSVLWIGEPDHSSHELGLKSELTERARTHADKLFGRVLEWWEREERSRNVQLVTMSDHGHGEIAAHVDFAGILKEAGFTVATDQEILKGTDPDAAQMVLVGDYTAGLWVKDNSVENLTKIARVLTANPGVGLVFSQPNPQFEGAVGGRVPGTLSEALVFSEHPRGPDLRIVGRGDNSTGRIVSGGHYGLGSGNHGGLTPAELHAHLAVAGTAFSAQARRHKAPAGHNDLAKTVLSILGIPLTSSPARELNEARCDGIDESYGVFTLRLSQGNLSMTIEQANYAGRRYVLSGEREDGEFPLARE